jgi:hypothetical protein
MSRQKENRLRLAKNIQLLSAPASTPCDYCFFSGSDCITMPDRLKCAKYVRRGRPCVNLTWSSLEKTIEEYSKKVNTNKEELVRLISRILRNKKIL